MVMIYINYAAFSRSGGGFA